MVAPGTAVEAEVAGGEVAGEGAGAIFCKRVTFAVSPITEAGPDPTVWPTFPVDCFCCGVRAMICGPTWCKYLTGAEFVLTDT